MWFKEKKNYHGFVFCQDGTIEYNDKPYKPIKGSDGYALIDRGSWFEAQFDTNALLYVYLDRKKRRRKFLITTLFRALGFLKEDGSKGTDQEILEMFYDIEELTLRVAGNRDNLADLVLVEDAVNEEENVIVARTFEPLSRAVL